MNIKTIPLLLILMTSLTILVSCGGKPPAISTPTPDIEATVEASIEEIRAEDSDRKVKVQTTAKTKTQATPTVVSTPPTTTTPETTPTPRVPSSTSILNNAKKAMAKLDSYHYELEMVMKVAGGGTKLEFPIDLSSDFKSPDRLRQTMSMALFGMQFESEYIRIGDQTYAKEPMSEWTSTYEFEGLDLGEMWSGYDENILDIPIASEPALEQIDGVNVYHMKWDLTEGSKGLLAFLNLFGDGSDSEEIPENIAVEFWVDIESYYLRKFALHADIPIDKETRDLFFSGLGADNSTSMSMEATLSAFNEVRKPIDHPKITPVATPEPPRMKPTTKPTITHTAIPNVALTHDSGSTSANSSKNGKNGGGKGKPDDQYACKINSDGLCIFTGIPHENGLQPGSNDVVSRSGHFLFRVEESAAANSSGEILSARGTPAFDGDKLVNVSQDNMTNDEKAFHKVMAIMFPIRNALMYDIAETNQTEWNQLVKELQIRNIKDLTFTNGRTPKDNYYGRKGVFDLAKNPNGRDIHHDVMKFLEEAGLYLLCHVTSGEFNQVLEDTHPEGHDPCSDAGIEEKTPF